MHVRTIILVLVALAASGATALAALAVKDPMQLILRPVDVPGAKRTVQQSPIRTGGVRGKFAGYSFYFVSCRLVGCDD